MPIARRLLLPTTRSLVGTAFVCHALLAVGWWLLMPGGFPLDSAWFWVNSVVPPAMLVVAGVGIWGWVRRPMVAATVAVALGVMWIASGVSGRLAFEVSLRWLFLGPILVGGFGILLGVSVWWGATGKGGHRRSWWYVPLVAFLAAALGAWLPWTQRGPAPTTLPITDLPATVGLPADDDTYTSGRGPYFVQQEPTLRFISRSPDRAPSILAPAARRRPPFRERTGAGEWVDEVSEPGDDAFPLVRHTLSATIDRDGIDLDGRATLRQPVWSHLNTYALLMLNGFNDLSVSFSPTGDERFAVQDSDYPFGKPSRFACVIEEAGQLRFDVLEASSAEKGPFKVLASAPIDRGDAITLTFHDGGEPIATWTIADFAAQASVDLSPTAGWGMPQNAIRFTLEGEGRRPTAAVYVTLAGTGVGRGFDTVAHAAGTYRTRHAWRWRVSTVAERQNFH